MSERGAEMPGARPPGYRPEHAVLARDEGTWDATIEVRPPGAPVQRSTGIARNRLACGGLWLLSQFKNNDSDFEGIGLYGYDPARGCYVATWVDPMRTFLAIGQGSWDPAAAMMTLRTEATVAGGRTLAWRETTQSVDDDTRVFRSFFPGPDGGEHEMMTVTYRRRRPGGEQEARP